MHRDCITGAGQREAIAARIADIGRITQEADNTLGPLRVFRDDGGRIAERADGEIRSRVAEANLRVWELLDPKQLDTLEVLLNPDLAPHGACDR